MCTLVPVASAAARAARRDGEARADVRFFPRVAHLSLAHHADVYAWIEACCAGRSREEAP